MSVRIHRMRQKAHHGVLELWLIGMRLEGTETQTHTQTHTSEGQYEGVDTITHKLRHRQRGLTDTHIFTLRNTNSTQCPGRSHG